MHGQKRSIRALNPSIGSDPSDPLDGRLHGNANIVQLFDGLLALANLKLEISVCHLQLQGTLVHPQLKFSTGFLKLRGGITEIANNLQQLDLVAHPKLVPILQQANDGNNEHPRQNCAGDIDGIHPQQPIGRQLTIDHWRRLQERRIGNDAHLLENGQCSKEGKPAGQSGQCRQSPKQGKADHHPANQGHIPEGLGKETKEVRINRVANRV